MLTKKLNKKIHEWERLKLESTDRPLKKNSIFFESKKSIAEEGEN
jgi:hypothetical protein